MSRYSEERKASVMKKLLPPSSRAVPDVAKKEGISDATLYNWRNQAKKRGEPTVYNSSKLFDFYLGA